MIKPLLFPADRCIPLLLLIPSVLLCIRLDSSERVRRTRMVVLRPRNGRAIYVAYIVRNEVRNSPKREMVEAGELTQTTVRSPMGNTLSFTCARCGSSLLINDY